MTEKLYINSIEELEKTILSFGKPETINLVCYIWSEYGFFPTIFNDYYKDFFDDCKGLIIGVCFEGHDIFYLNKASLI